jgi:uncharacterized protein YndB with AHSA1/START domain
MTERMYGDGIPADAPETVNEMTLTAVEGGTLLAFVMIFPDAETRDMALGTGMVGGMETSYARLERTIGTA